jgi:hypothetical protein
MSEFAKVTRLHKQAEEIPNLLGGLRADYRVTKFLVLREVGGMKLDTPDWDSEGEEHPNVVPGALVEGARFVEHDGYQSVELTVWGKDEMHLLMVGQQTPVVVFEVEDLDVTKPDFSGYSTFTDPQAAI